MALYLCVQDSLSLASSGLQCYEVNQCCRALTEGGGGDGLRFERRRAVPRGQIGPSVVSALIVIVLDVQAGEFGEADAQRTASVIDVLSIQRLENTCTHTHNSSTEIQMGI